MKIRDGKCRRCKAPSRGTRPDTLCDLCKVMWKEDRRKYTDNICKGSGTK